MGRLTEILDSSAILSSARGGAALSTGVLSVSEPSVEHTLPLQEDQEEEGVAASDTLLYRSRQKSTLCGVVISEGELGPALADVDGGLLREGERFRFAYERDPAEGEYRLGVGGLGALFR